MGSLSDDLLWAERFLADANAELTRRKNLTCPRCANEMEWFPIGLVGYTAWCNVCDPEAGTPHKDLMDEVA